VGDLVRHLWSQRVPILKWFAGLAGIGAVGVLAWWLFGTRTAEVLVSLTFRGIERHEYPSGKKFSVEDFRAPEVVKAALVRMGRQAGGVDVKQLQAGIDAEPVVPSEMAARWKKQDRDGLRREEFLPGEFRLSIHPKGFGRSERLNFLYALVESYKDTIRWEQDAAGRRVSLFTTMPPEEMVKTFEYLDLTDLFHVNEAVFERHLKQLIVESQDFRDPRFRASFNELKEDLRTWQQTRLDPIAALVRREKLVRNKSLLVERLTTRRDDLEIDIQRLKREADQATQLLETIDRSRPALAGTLQSKDGTPLIDATALEKVVKSDYIGPVVRIVTELRKEAGDVEARKARVMRDLALIQQPGAVETSKVPPELEQLVILTTHDLADLVERYRKLLSSYLDATISSAVTLREGPYTTLAGPKVTFVAIGILFAAGVLSLLVVMLRSEITRN
jgi:hypothetical protein